ncbi:zinc transporter ZupT [Desulfovibrio sp. OttesenSCG-928-C06]|nr:zinc transporter ZupT [Desulfovibrio sp. OttesenSCG-928-C06]
METSAILLAFGLTLIAGLSTGIGSLISLLAKKQNPAFLSVALGFSAGVMIYVSFVELLTQASSALTGYWGQKAGSWATVGAFFGGIALIAVIDKLVPDSYNPHELGHSERLGAKPEKANTLLNAKTDPAKLRRTGFLTALAITIHNFPEGIATFMAALTDPALGVAITVAIAIHNIPEGIAVAVPIYYASGSRKKALLYSFLSGLAEPFGALVGFLILLPLFTPAVFGISFAMVAGIMVFISLDELLPAAEEYGEHHLCIYGMVAGMAVMAVSLLVL